MAEKNVVNEITVRLYEENDYAGFLDCLKGFYGDGYPYNEYLDADLLREKIQRGELILTVAVNSQGKIIGTVGAQYMYGAFEGSVLLLLRNIRAQYRGMGISSYQLNDLLERVKKAFPQARTIYADVMTHDTVSQNSLIHRGYALCALRLMVYKNEIIVPHLTYAEHTKMTQAVYCTSLGKDLSVSVYAPLVHQKEISRLYDTLGVKVSFLQPTLQLCGKTECKVNVKEVHSNIEIIIEKVGNGFDERLDTIIDMGSGYDDITYTVYLNISRVESLSAYDSLIKKGFYYSGIKPLSLTGEYMILAKTDGCNERFEDICLPEKNTDLIDYIKQHRKRNERES